MRKAQTDLKAKVEKAKAMAPPPTALGRTRPPGTPSEGTATPRGAGDVPTPPDALKDSSDGQLQALAAALRARRRGAAGNLATMKQGPGTPKLAPKRLLGY